MDKSKMMMFVIIALLLLLLGTVVGVGLYLVSVSGGDSDWDIPQDPAVITQLMPAEMRFVSLGSLTANLALGPNNRSDNLVLEVSVGLNATVPPAELEDFYDVFNRGVNIARAEVIDVLINRTFDQVRTGEGKNETAEIIKFRLQEAFGSNLIVKVSFPQWNAVRGR